ncbi:MAG TPA: nitrophenyl compound nitroreductase subunit ArsF family protein [Candidatus Gastranaerophilaceae bacterium]|nr:nitrophenyl compound nitroreductase subunit ArsF family protein [Candidatus Gastranaerophilaceae bacterium]HPT41070.1 nitrophenyl compound nitroreductase subunit ArsF family protein [Candidatus Gastranaerophilaceae bacterium]
MKKLLLILTILLGFSNTVFAADKVNVYYFYGKPRCVTCQKIENYTKQAVESMKDKDVNYKSIDMEKSENSSMVKKYNLFTKSVVISKTKNGKEQWKNLDKVWLKVGNEQDFKNYIITETKIFKGSK